MFRLMAALFAFLWSAMLDAGDGSGAGGDGGGGEGGPEKFELTADELTNRTTAAADARVKELAGVLGVDLSNPADVKAMIEAGRKAQQQSQQGGGDKGGSSGAEGGSDEGLDQLLDTMGKLVDRIDGVEGKLTERDKAEAAQERTEKITAALKEANVRDDQLENALRYAGTFDLKVNDKGELEGAEDAIENVKKAMPNAFRGDGDTGNAADANGRESSDRKPRTLQEALTAHYSKS